MNCIYGEMVQNYSQNLLMGLKVSMKFNCQDVVLQQYLQGKGRFTAGEIMKWGSLVTGINNTNKIQLALKNC
jgi:hypothetical protein